MCHTMFTMSSTQLGSMRLLWQSRFNPEFYLGPPTLESDQNSLYPSSSKQSDLSERDDLSLNSYGTSLGYDSSFQHDCCYGHCYHSKCQRKREDSTLKKKSSKERDIYDIFKDFQQAGDDPHNSLSRKSLLDLQRRQGVVQDKIKALDSGHLELFQGKHNSVAKHKSFRVSKGDGHNNLKENTTGQEELTIFRDLTDTDGPNSSFKDLVDSKEHLLEGSTLETPRRLFRKKDTPSTERRSKGSRRGCSRSKDSPKGTVERSHTLKRFFKGLRKIKRHTSSPCILLSVESKNGSVDDRASLRRTNSDSTIHSGLIFPNLEALLAASTLRIPRPKLAGQNTSALFVPAKLVVGCLLVWEVMF